MCVDKAQFSFNIAAAVNILLTLFLGQSGGHVDVADFTVRFHTKLNITCVIHGIIQMG